MSLSARRAWIEMAVLMTSLLVSMVALRKESVDRNNPLKTLIILAKVALRKESVDRNACQNKIGRLLVASLSARRAWIEIKAA